MQNSRTKTSEVRAIQRVHRWIRTGRLRELRVDSGLSQSDVARHLEVAASNVSRWENDQTRPRGPHAVALVDLFDGD
jgi:DNA-binding transcriptional regulator YiaG